MKSNLVKVSIFVLFCVVSMTAQAGEVAMYTGVTSWIGGPEATAQAQITADRLATVGVASTVFTDENLLKAWVDAKASDGQVDVLILYGALPASIYAFQNSEADGSSAELFIESTDGNAIINHADWMFYVSSAGCCNGNTALANIMDLPCINMANPNIDVKVTADGSAIAPSLTNFTSYRPLWTDRLSGEWFVEKSLAQNAFGTRADPIIVRDGDRGRIIPCIQRDGVNPIGAVASEIIAWLMDTKLMPTRLGISCTGPAKSVTDTAVVLEVSLLDDLGIPTPSDTDVTVDLATSSDSGAFDSAFAGSYNGTVSSVTIPAGKASAAVFYKDSVVGVKSLTGSAAGLTGAQLDVDIIAENLAGLEGEVAIFTGAVGWTTKEAADIQAQLCVDRLTEAGIANTWYQSTDQEADLVAWMTDRTADGNVDVLILYGSLPDSIYTLGNSQVDGSVAEQFIETTDGDAIINHGDWMFYVSSVGCCNGPTGLQNMMDNQVGITMSGNRNPMTATPEGMSISSSLTDFVTDRPLHIDMLDGNWFVEAALARSGILADPVIVRDGNLGRIIPIFQANSQFDPKGAVAAEVCAWLMDQAIDPAMASQWTYSLAGSGLTVQNTPVKLKIMLMDATGELRPMSDDTSVGLSSDSPTGAFSADLTGTYDGVMDTLTIPAGDTSAVFYYSDSEAGIANLEADIAALGDAKSVQVEILESLAGTPGTVVIYTGDVNWVEKEKADAQAQICADNLNAAGIPATAMSEAGPDAKNELATWMQGATNDGKVDVLVLYGKTPSVIYAGSNGEPDGSIAETFIESTDGNAIVNHGDYMFYVSDNGNSGDAGLVNMMDNTSGISLWGDLDMFVTEEGAVIAPSLNSFFSNRALHVDQLDGDWFVEAALARNEAGTIADPVIVRDGNRGRLIPLYGINLLCMTPPPVGAVTAEVLSYLLNTPPAVEISEGAPSNPENAELCYEEVVFQLAAEISDVNSDALTYQWEVSPSDGCELLQADTLEPELHVTAVGTYTVTCSVSDGQSHVESAPLELTVGECTGMFLMTGDANCSGSVDIADVVTLLSYLFAGEDLCCPAASDVNDDDDVDIADPIGLLYFHFHGRSMIAPDGMDVTEAACRLMYGAELECENPCN